MYFAHVTRKAKMFQSTRRAWLFVDSPGVDVPPRRCCVAFIIAADERCLVAQDHSAWRGGRPLYAQSGPDNLGTRCQGTRLAHHAKTFFETTQFRWVHLGGQGSPPHEWNTHARPVRWRVDHDVDTWLVSPTQMSHPFQNMNLDEIRLTRIHGERRKKITTWRQQRRRYAQISRRVFPKIVPGTRKKKSRGFSGARQTSLGSVWTAL